MFARLRNRSGSLLPRSPPPPPPPASSPPPPPPHRSVVLARGCRDASNLSRRYHLDPRSPCSPVERDKLTGCSVFSQGPPEERTRPVHGNGIVFSLSGARDSPRGPAACPCAYTSHALTSADLLTSCGIVGHREHVFFSIHRLVGTLGAIRAPVLGSRHHRHTTEWLATTPYG